MLLSLHHRRQLTVPALVLVLTSLATPPVVSQTQSPKSPPTAGPDKAAWKTLFDGKSLDGWKPSEFFGAGKVRIVDGTIVMEQGKSMTGITFAGKDFPRSDYEITLEGKKLAGDDFFCTTTFPVGKDYCSFVVGGWGGTIVGLSSINSEDAASNETSKSMDFKRDKWYRFRIRVSEHRIETWIDDEKMVDQDISGVRVSTRIECRLSQPFGIATYETTGAVRNIRLRSLSDAEKKSAEQKKPDVGFLDRLRTDYGEPAAQFDAKDVAALASKYIGKKISVRGVVDHIDVTDPQHCRVYLKEGISVDMLHLEAMAKDCKPGSVVTLDGILKQHGAKDAVLVPGARRDDNAPFKAARP
jgi:hypothetical protein